MIGALRGKVIARPGDGIILDVSGVGYELLVTASVHERAGTTGELQVFVFTDLRENSLSLYGFSSLLEREVFLFLRKVKGIGSRIALAVLSSLGAQGVLSAIARDDLQSLKNVSGVGPKTAERILVELREAVGQLLPQEPSRPLSKRVERLRSASSGEGSGLTISNAIEDTVLALEKLGFSSAHAREAVATTLETHAEQRVTLSQDASELLRLALSAL